MIKSALQLSDVQIRSFDEFLLDGTDNALRALETVFELGIESSDSSIEIAPTGDNENLQHFGSGCLYIISSSLVGEVSGGFVLFMKAEDFNYLGQVMQPVMSLLFMADSDAEQQVPDNQTSALPESPVTGEMDAKRYQEHMLDALAEMANILIGLYTKSIYRIFGLKTHHTVPLVMKDAKQMMTQRVLSFSGGPSKQHMAIENEFFLKDKPIKLWCLISPAEDSFQNMLSGYERIKKQSENSSQENLYKFKP